MLSYVKVHQNYPLFLREARRQCGTTKEHIFCGILETGILLEIQLTDSQAKAKYSTDRRRLIKSGMEVLN